MEVKCCKRTLYIRIIALNIMYWLLSILFMFVEGDLMSYWAQVYAVGGPVVITSISLSFYIVKKMVPSRYPLAAFTVMFLVSFLMVSLLIYLARLAVVW